MLTALLAASSPASVLASPKQSCSDPYAGAIQLMRAFYPQLSQKGINVDVQSQYPFDADGPLLVFEVTVSEHDQEGHIVAQPSSNPSSALRVGHLGVHFQFDARDQGILLMFAKGSLVNSDKLEALQKQMNEHSDWNESQMTKAIEASGAKFGPNAKEAVLARLPIKDLEALLGKIESPTASFRFRGNDEPPHYSVIEWSVQFRAVEGRAVSEFTLSIEPFEGKIISLGRRKLQ